MSRTISARDILIQKSRQLLLVRIALLAYRLVVSLHGDSPFKVWQPDSFRIRRNCCSTFNYGWDILGRRPYSESSCCRANHPQGDGAPSPCDLSPVRISADVTIGLESRGYCVHGWHFGERNTTASIRTVRSITECERSSGRKQTIRMWQAKSPSNIRTA
jgi:hypothetical protein